MKRGNIFVKMILDFQKKKNCRINFFLQKETHQDYTFFKIPYRSGTYLFHQVLAVECGD